MFWQFRANALFLNPWLGEYICLVPSKQVFKLNASLAKNMVSLNRPFGSSIDKLKVNCMPIAYFIFSLFTINAFFFQFLSRDMRMYIPIPTGVQNWRIRSWKNGHIWLNIATIATFESLNDKVKVNCMPMALLIFWQFKIKVWFFSSQQTCWSLI